MGYFKDIKRFLEINVEILEANIPEGWRDF
jgi:hypothetical protein